MRPPSSGPNSPAIATATVHHAWLATLFAAPPTLVLLANGAGRLRRRRLLISNRCLGCGYDLRATPDRCPECGAVPAVKEAIA